MSDDPNLWAMGLSPMYPGGPALPTSAHLIVRRFDGGFRGEVRVAACGIEFTAGTHPRGWWSTRSGRLPLQDHAICCGREIVLAQAAGEGVPAATVISSDPSSASVNSHGGEASRTGDPSGATSHTAVLPDGVRSGPSSSGSGPQ
jgi:hypothetical protein